MAGVQSIERAFSVLRVLARGTAGVTEIAERTELPKSTVSRLLSALEHEGAVVQSETGGGYSVGPALATLGAAGPTASVRSTVRPFIEELSAITGGSSGYTLRDGDSAFWVDNVDDGDELVLVADQTGQSFPLHTVASGLAVLAKLSSDELDGYLDRMSETETESMSPDPDELRRRLASVRADGVVVSREDMHPGVNAFAAAFRGPGGDWDGAIYVQGPSFRFPDAGDEQRVVKLVVESATQLSDRLVGR
ncbi:IclR family transcriptional regulator [Ilumatobacter nonamiensis]|uniref:IclR family transcriptional regulator n=1 Tax=Ilumatobacter nonamiensis TaxID=467093 RepID=UPI0006886596|nr:IclR family transcriptional regulator [Ilumatobacter nonamiensis]